MFMFFPVCLLWTWTWKNHHICIEGPHRGPQKVKLHMRLVYNSYKFSFFSRCNTVHCSSILAGALSSSTGLKYMKRRRSVLYDIVKWDAAHSKTSHLAMIINPKVSKFVFYMLAPNWLQVHRLREEKENCCWCWNVHKALKSFLLVSLL